MTEQERQACIVRMKTGIKMSELFAIRWIAMATTGASGRRNVHRGDHKLTSDELTDQALNVATTHILQMQERAENLALVIEGREDEQRCDGFLINPLQDENTI